MITLFIADQSAVEPLLHDLRRIHNGPPVALVDGDIEEVDEVVQLLAARNWKNVTVVSSKPNGSNMFPVTDFADKVMVVGRLPMGLKIEVLR